MKKSEMVDILVRETDRSRELCQRALDGLFTAIADEVAHGGGEVKLPELGTLRRAGRAGGPGRNPRTGAPITIAPLWRLTIKGGSAMKRRFAALRPPAARQAAE